MKNSSRYFVDSHWCFFFSGHVAGAFQLVAFHWYFSCDSCSCQIISKWVGGIGFSEHARAQGSRREIEENRSHGGLSKSFKDPNKYVI